MAYKTGRSQVQGHIEEANQRPDSFDRETRTNEYLGLSSETHPPRTTLYSLSTAAHYAHDTVSYVRPCYEAQEVAVVHNVAGVYEGRLNIPCARLEDEPRGTVGRVHCLWCVYSI